MAMSYHASTPVAYHAKSCILQRRREQYERIWEESVKKIQEVNRMDQMTNAKTRELQAINKKLSEECNKVEVDIHTLENRELANKEEIKCLESTFLELKKRIAVETEGQQHLLIKKNQAETDKEKSQQELIKMHDVLLKAIAYYKRKLHIHLRIDENGVILIHLLNISTPGCKMCSLKLSYGDGKWSLLGMEPVLPCEKVLANKLETTQDIQGFISHVRQLFFQMSGSKKHTAGKKMSKK